MDKYIGMNFQERCALDTEDMRIINIILKTNSGTYIYTSDIEIEYIDLLLIRESTIVNIELKNNEWYIELVIDKQ